MEIYVLILHRLLFVSLFNWDCYVFLCRFPDTSSSITCTAPSTTDLLDPCPSARSSRGSTWPQSGMQNIMSYVMDSCATEFTEHQKKRMRCYLDQSVSAHAIDPNDPSYPGGPSPHMSGPSYTSFLSIHLATVCMCVAIFRIVLGFFKRVFVFLPAVSP